MRELYKWFDPDYEHCGYLIVEKLSPTVCVVVDDSHWNESEKRIGERIQDMNFMYTKYFAPLFDPNEILKSLL